MVPVKDKAPGAPLRLGKPRESWQAAVAMAWQRGDEARTGARTAFHEMRLRCVVVSVVLLPSWGEMAHVPVRQRQSLLDDDSGGSLNLHSSP